MDLYNSNFRLIQIFLMDFEIRFMWTTLYVQLSRTLINIIIAHARFCTSLLKGAMRDMLILALTTDQNSQSVHKIDKMQLSTTDLAIAILCISVACTTVQSLTVRGIGRVRHTARELKEDQDKFVTDPSANVKGKFRCY